MYDAPPDVSFIFVIDTESYAGNFERPMCAYCTGEIGECGVGEEEAALFRQEMGIAEGEDGPFCDKIMPRADEHGCHRPTSIWHTAGWFNHGMGGHYKDGQEAEALEDHKQKCREEGDRKPYGENDEANERHRQEWYAKAEEPLHKFPAYNSVAIFFSTVPTDEEINMIRQRALKFGAERPDCTKDWQKKEPIKITGFRLIQEVVHQNTVRTWNVEEEES